MRGLIVLRADSGFENHKLMRTLDRQGVEFSIGIKQRKQIKALIDEIPETDWTWVPDYPETGEAQIAETKLGSFRLIVRRTRLVGAQAELFPDWRYHAFATNRTVPTLVADIDHRDHATIELVIRDLKDQALCHFPSGRFHRQQRLDRDRRPGAQPRPLDNPDRPTHRTRPNRPRPPASPPGDPGPTDPHQPPLDTPAPSPLAMEDRLHHRAGRDPGAPRPSLTGLAPSHTTQPTPRPTPARSACTKPAPDVPAGTSTHPQNQPTGSQTPPTHSHTTHNPARALTHPQIRVTSSPNRWFQAKKWIRLERLQLAVTEGAGIRFLVVLKAQRSSSPRRHELPFPPWRIEVMPTQIRGTAALHRTTEGDFRAQLAPDLCWRSSALHRIDLTTYDLLVGSFRG